MFDGCSFYNQQEVNRSFFIQWKHFYAHDCFWQQKNTPSMATFHPRMHFAFIFPGRKFPGNTLPKHYLNSCEMFWLGCHRDDNYAPVTHDAFPHSSSNFCNQPVAFHWCPLQGTWHCVRGRNLSQVRYKQPSHYFGWCQISVNKVLSFQHLFCLSFCARGAPWYSILFLI